MTTNPWLNTSDTVRQFTNASGVLFNILPASRPQEPTLANHLYWWAQAEAQSQGVENVLTDDQYNAIMETLPTTLTALSDIIGQKKAIRYGEALLELVRRHAI